MGINEDHPARRFRIHVDLANQRATLYEAGNRLFETPISSGRKSHPTPTGRYLVTDKYTMWKSTLYHAKMPHFLRLSCGDFGLHAGVLPGYPASHGCIRLPKAVAKDLFDKIPVGTLVEIE
jgi:lipoprotein-anchoring transpeptidase ErfK/SrfK